MFLPDIALLHSKSSPSINLPVIPTFRDIANLIECVAMFCFVKRLLAFRIMIYGRTYRNYYHGLMKRLDIPRLTRTAPQLCNTLH